MNTPKKDSLTDHLDRRDRLRSAIKKAEELIDKNMQARALMIKLYRRLVHDLNFPSREGDNRAHRPSPGNCPTVEPAKPATGQQADTQT
jgi:hypothetical protein